MSYFEYGVPFDLKASAAPFKMGPSTTQLFVRYDRERPSRTDPHGLCRPDLASNHACWPAPRSPWWWWHVWSDSHPLETGVMAVLAGRGLSLMLMFFHF
jgi:hypothetical protein